jgi:hypothetical protein
MPVDMGHAQVGTELHFLPIDLAVLTNGRQIAFEAS